MRHVIRKQVIQIQAPHDSGIYQLQQEMSHYYHTKIIPVLEKIFDELSNEDQVLIFDHIELDMNLFKPAENNCFLSKDELYPLLRKQFENQIKDADSIRSENYFTGTESGISLKKTQAVHAFDQWLYYMQHGILHWNMHEMSDTLIELVLYTLSTDLHAANRLTKTIIHYPATALRIIRLHEEKFLVSLVEALTAKQQSMLPELIHLLSDFFVDSTQPTSIEKLWLSVLTAAIKKSDHKNTDQLLQKVFELICIPEHPTQEKLIEMAEKNIILQPVLAPFIHSKKNFSKERFYSSKGKKRPSISSEKESNGLTKTTKAKDSFSKKLEAGQEEKTDWDTTIPCDQTDKDKKTEQSSTKKTDVSTTNELIFEQNSKENSTEILQSLVNEKLVVYTPDSDFHKTTDELLEEGIFVQNAGLILLHPFFQFLFRNTGLSNGGIFVDRMAQQKAIYLLHYIASGETNAEEYLLAMPKLICGWPVTEPIVANAALTDSMLTEADDLVRAAIAQWTILKNTSVEGLRESFLQREGKLFTKTDKLYIQVEKKSIDMLLDHLPWNTSIVKFPWLKNILWVEWR